LDSSCWPSKKTKSHFVLYIDFYVLYCLARNLTMAKSMGVLRCIRSDFLFCLSFLSTNQPRMSCSSTIYGTPKAIEPVSFHCILHCWPPRSFHVCLCSFSLFSGRQVYFEAGGNRLLVAVVVVVDPWSRSMGFCHFASLKLKWVPFCQRCQETWMRNHKSALQCALDVCRGIKMLQQIPSSKITFDSSRCLYIFKN